MWRSEYYDRFPCTFRLGRQIRIKSRLALSSSSFCIEILSFQLDRHIKFSEVLETMHEYPSEASLLVEDEQPIAGHDDSVVTTMSPKSNVPLDNTHVIIIQRCSIFVFVRVETKATYIARPRYVKEFSLNDGVKNDCKS